MKFVDAIFFFESPDEKNIRSGVLKTDDKGRYFVEFEGTWIDTFRVIDVIFAESKETKELYTLVNCVIKESVGNQCQFSVNEIYKGSHLAKVTEINCMGATMKMSGLTEWINYSRIGMELTFSGESSRIVAKDMFTWTFSVDNINFELGAFCNYKISRKQVVLTNESQLRVSVNKMVSRLEIQQISLSFCKLLSLFTERFPAITDMELEFENEVRVNCLHFHRDLSYPDNNRLLSFDQFKEHFQQLLTSFYSDREKYEKVIDLLNASLQTKAAETAFLNITTAFELFHKSFLQKGTGRSWEPLVTELIHTGHLKVNPGGWNQDLRYFHLFKMVNDVEFFTNNFPNPFKTVELIRESRNYYTHYGKTAKEIWSPNRLIYANEMLRQLIKGVLLKQLKFPNDLVNRLLNYRFATIFYRHEKNEYSIYFNPDEYRKIDS